MRYPWADYSNPEVYFITICTHNREPLFGEVLNGEMHIQDFGAIVWDIWQSLPSRFPEISLDTAIVMPDHFHGIIVVNQPPNNLVGAIHELPLPNEH